MLQCSWNRSLKVFFKNPKSPQTVMFDIFVQVRVFFNDNHLVFIKWTWIFKVDLDMISSTLSYNLIVHQFCKYTISQINLLGKKRLEPDCMFLFFHFAYSARLLYMVNHMTNIVMDVNSRRSCHFFLIS